MSRTTQRKLQSSRWYFRYRRLRENTGAWLSLCVLCGLLLLSVCVPFFSEHRIDRPRIEEGFQGASLEHFLGTDENGYDVFVRLCAGGRVSLGIGIVCVLCSAGVGVVVGACAGYFGGVADSLLMRFTDMMLSLPVLPLLLILSAFDYEKKFVFEYLDVSFLGTTEWGRFVLIVLVISAFSWMQIARLVRGEVLSLKECTFIEAAEVLGASHARILIKHVIPNVLTPVLVASTLSFGGVIQYEAVLSFLGLGINPLTPSWGNMLSNSIEYLTHSSALFIYPGVLISITVLCVNILGDSLRELLNEKHSSTSQTGEYNVPSR